MTLILADTTVLSNFAQVGRQDLLQQAFPELSAPRAVREELSAGERLGRVPRGDWSWLAPVEARDGLVLTDDSAARRLAGALHLRISGTIGALVRLVRREVLSLPQGESLLAEMMKRGYRSPVRSLREVLAAEEAGSDEGWR